MINQAMFSSATDVWATPQWLFDRVNAVFNFELDVCALPENAKCKRFFTPEMNGLDQIWGGAVWMNPPYGKEIGLWVKKAYESAKQNGATVVCLLPARTDTRYWQQFCTKGEILFLAGRLKFGNATSGAPFPSALVVFRPTLSDIDLVKP